jgi:hypothetical protein
MEICEKLDSVESQQNDDELYMARNEFIHTIETLLISVANANGTEVIDRDAFVYVLT